MPTMILQTAVLFLGSGLGLGWVHIFRMDREVQNPVNVSTCAGVWTGRVCI